MCERREKWENYKECQRHCQETGEEEITEHIFKALSKNECFFPEVRLLNKMTTYVKPGITDTNVYTVVISCGRTMSNL